VQLVFFMHKITIIVLFLAFSTTVIFTELAFQDYLAKLYPSYEQKLSSKAQSTYKKVEDLFQSEASIPDSKNQVEEPALAGSLRAATTPKEALKVDPEIKEIKQQKLPEDSQSIFNPVFLETLLSIKLQPRAFNNRLFELVDVDSRYIENATEYVYKAEGTEYLVLSEVQINTIKSPESLFDELKALAESLPGIETNQTDTFFDKSFYLNNKTKTQQVYLIGLKGERIVGMYYYKSFHPRLKVQFGN